MDFHHFDTSCRSALKNCFRPCPQYTGSPPLNSDYEGSKIDLLSKIWIFFEKMQKVEFFKKSEKNLVTSKMKQNPSSCSFGIWNYHLVPSKLKSRILPCPYASPLCSVRRSSWCATTLDTLPNMPHFKGLAMMNLLLLFL